MNYALSVFAYYICHGIIFLKIVQRVHNLFTITKMKNNIDRYTSYCNNI